LRDIESGRVVWGEVGGAYADPATPEGARVIARSMRPEIPSPDVRPDGVLDEFRYRSLSLRLRPYFRILRVLGAAGYRDEDLSRRSVDYDGQHLNSFQFAYDWRLDNAENARRLHEFILEKEAYCRADRSRRGQPPETIRFDIIAHSMGSLLTRYYLRYGPQALPDDGSLPELTWEGAQHVERVILVAPPNAGSLKAVLNLTRGVRHAPGFPFYDAALNGTFPSAYQLLPRGRHGAVVEARDPSQELPTLLDPELWERAGWGLAEPDEELLHWLLPEVEGADERRRIALSYQRRMLRLAEQFQRALDVPATPPAGTELFLIAGDSIPTPAVVAVDADSGEIEVIERGPGDGSVLSASALSSGDGSPITWREVAFIHRKHSLMPHDPVFAQRVVRWFLETPRG
ncbi:MAG: hypothetical protein AAF657_34920, partial [Acidobacteriota bacterium]